MKLSRDTLQAFVAAAELGSFSAAARRLGKSQSTVSEAVAGLEIDLDLRLFDRSGRQPVLTEAGRAMHAQAAEALRAQDRLARLAGRLGAGLEPRLTLVVSDTYQSPRLDGVLAHLDRTYPELEVETLVAEGADALELVTRGRAHLGLVESRPVYPSELAAATALDSAELGLFVADTHPLAGEAVVTREHLALHRELRLNTVIDAEPPTTSGRCWSAPSFLLLMEMAQQGYGWAPLPLWLVRRYGGERLRELPVTGWPRRASVDAVWSTRRPLGAAGHWTLQRLTVAEPEAAPG